MIWIPKKSLCTSVRSRRKASGLVSDMNNQYHTQNLLYKSRKCAFSEDDQGDSLYITALNQHIHTHEAYIQHSSGCGPFICLRITNNCRNLAQNLSCAGKTEFYPHLQISKICFHTEMSLFHRPYPSRG